jgi:peptidoglycan/LPS O-acetylase OafA/YrhL
MQQKQHFVMMDGLRGIAAVGVSIYHGGIIFGGTQLLPQAYLAVDFFFLLSGVVVAHAYEARLQQGKTLDYLQRRAIRLYPMILVGALLGLSVIATSPGSREMSFWSMGTLYLLASLCLPLLKPNVFPGTSSIAPLNGPSWSLFFEIFINAVYGFAAKRLATKALVATVVVSLIVEAIGIFHYQTADFGVYVSEFGWGFARVTFPFSAGVLIHRIMASRTMRLPVVHPAVPAALLIITFGIPAQGMMNAVISLVDIALIYPLLIIFAMRENLSGRQSAALIWLGVISYPLYIIHFPIFMWLARLQRFIPARFEVSPYVWSVSAIALAVICALCAYHLYDLPLRSLLTRMNLRKSRLGQLAVEVHAAAQYYTLDRVQVLVNGRWLEGEIHSRGIDVYNIRVPGVDTGLRDGFIDTTVDNIRLSNTPPPAAAA